jgi:hypothetical protein
VQWHWFRHAQWHQDEITDALLEALAKEEEGQEGTAKGRGSVFRLMFAALEAAEPTKAALVQSGLPASVVLDNLRAGAAGRTREVTRLAKDFRAYLPCFRQHRKVMEYLTTLNQMTDFPDPRGDPPGDIGRFIGAYMRKHVIVDHDAVSMAFARCAESHKALQLSAKQAQTGATALLEKAVAKLDPKIAAEVRQNRGPKVLKDFLDGRAELKERQAKITREYEEAYLSLAAPYQEAFRAIAPQTPTARSFEREPQPSNIPEASKPPPPPEVRPAQAEASKPLPPPEARPEQRLALVIGNSQYQETPLRNPVNDARAMVQTLRDVGFEVMAHENLAKRAMEEAIRAFGKRLKAGGVGLFYFSGHGVQINGSNYLIPIGSTIEKEQDVAYEAVEAGASWRNGRSRQPFEYCNTRCLPEQSLRA